MNLFKPPIRTVEKVGSKKQTIATHSFFLACRLNIEQLAKLMRFLLIALGTLYCVNAYSQDSTLAINLSAVISGSTGSTPFWVHANKNGSIPIGNYFTSGQWGIYKVYNPNNPRLLQFSGGAELITNYSQKSDVFFTDLYAAVKVGSVELLVGQKRNTIGIVDSTLSSGALAMSGNSRPFPRIQLGVNEFQPLAITNDIVSIKGSISEGYLGSSNINYGSVPRINNTYFHQKQLYFRVGSKPSRAKVYFGINHQAIWGGEKQLNPIENLSLAKSYLYVITGKSLNYRSIGNHFGTSDIAVDIKIKKWKLLVYRNNIYETGSVFKLINIYDGLNGLTFTRTYQSNSRLRSFRLFSINLEYISLYNQKNQFQPSELVRYQIANYYNSYIYQRGWSYGGFGIGSPLTPSKETTNEKLPRNVSQFTNNNKIRAFHTAVTGQFLGINLLFKATYSLNSGSYLAPFDKVKNQCSIYLSGEKNISLLHGTTISAGLASDIGDLYRNSTGIFVGIKKRRFIN